MRDDDPRIKAALGVVALAQGMHERQRRDYANEVLSRDAYLGWALGYRYIQNIRDHLTGATWESQEAET